MNTLLFIGHPKEENLALFAGGELGPLARWRIEQHLEKCSTCQDVVADFFHLHSNVSELAELPPIDWNELAQDIGARVRLETPDVEEAKGGWFAHHPWQVGLATAALLCTFVVVRQFPSVSQGLREEAPLASSARLQRLAPAEANKPGGDYLKVVPPPANSVEPEQPAANAPSQTAQAAGQSAAAVNELAYAGPARRDESVRMPPVLAPDTEAVAPPVDQKALMRQVPGAAPTQEAAASRAREEAELKAIADAEPSLAPAAPPSPVGTDAQKELDAGAVQGFRAEVRAKQGVSAGYSVAADANAAVANATEKRKTERLALSQQPRAAAPLGALRGQQQGLMKKADADGALTPQRGFTVLPAALEDPNVDVGVAADGWISVRSVDGNTGTITITDVYVP